MVERRGPRDPGPGARAHGPALARAAHARAARPPEVPDEVTAGSGTVGVRLSPHPVARGLVRALGAPITAPSANLSGRPAPTTAAAVFADFRDRIDLVLDGGATAGGEPSTVLDVTVDPPRVIRAGALGRRRRAGDRRHPGRRQEHADGRAAQGAARAGRPPHHRAGGGRDRAPWWTMC